jgi:1-acyl-sn-glycerol-3-phosphate acyltransferase
MKIFKYLFYIIWRCWFYGWVLLSIVAIFPVLIVVTSTENLYPIFFKIARAWGKTILFVMGFKVVVSNEQVIEKDKNYKPSH